MGCAAFDLTGVEDEDAGPDGGVGGDRDASFADAGGLFETDFGGVPADPSRAGAFSAEAPVPPGMDGDDAAALRATCYDAVDNDAPETAGAGLTDCADPQCSSLASCCIGEVGCAAVREAPVPLEEFSCGEAELMDCIAGLAPRAFGSPGPFHDAGGLAPGGDAEYDSGVLLAAPLDLRIHRAEIRAGFERGTCTGEARCLESVAVGFTTHGDLSNTQHVEPLVALQLSPARGRMHLLVEGRVVAQTDVLSTSSAEAWTLELTPDGQARATSDDGRMLSHQFPVAPSATLVVWGHTENPSGGLPDGESRVRLSSLQVGLSACDMPTTWSPTSNLPLFDGSTPIVDEPEVLSAAFWQDAVWLAYRVSDNEIRVAREGDSGFETVSPPTLPEWADRWGGVTLVVDATGRLRLVAAVEEDMDGAPVRTVFIDQFRTDLGWTAPVERTLPAVPWRSFQLLHHGGHEIFVAVDNGVRVFVQRPGRGGWEETGLNLRAQTAGAIHASITVHAGSYRLYTTFARGTHRRIALWASDELVAWRAVHDEVLAERDAHPLGASGASAVSQGDALRLFFVGLRGDRSVASEVRRTAPSDARFAGGT